MTSLDSSARAPAAGPVALEPALSSGPLPPPPPRPPAPPNIRPSVAISSIATSAFPGPVTITGSTDPGTVWFWNSVDNTWDERPAVTFTGVAVSFDSGEAAAATSADQWATWTATVTLQKAGVHVGTATASWSTGSVQSSAQCVAGTPTLTVSSPADQTVVPLMETGADVTVAATTGAWLGGLTVTAASGQNSVNLTSDATGTSWQGLLHLDPMPLGNRLITIVASAKVASPPTSTVVRTVDGVDKAPPHLAVSYPPAGGKVVVDASLAVHLAGTCTDTQSGVSGGSASVQVALSSSGPFAAAAPARLVTSHSGRRRSPPRPSARSTCTCRPLTPPAT